MISLVTILTIINLCLLSAILFFRENSSKPNKILALIIFLPAIPFALNYLLYLGVLFKYPYIMLITVPYLWAPCVLWYVLIMVGEKVSINFKLFPHFVLQIIFTSSILALCLSPDSYRTPFIEGVFHQNFPWQLTAFNFILMIQSFAYLVYTYIKIKRVINGYAVEGVDIKLSGLKINWLRELVISLIGINIAVVVLSFFISMEMVAYIVCPAGYSIFYILILYEAFRNSAVFSSVEFKNYVTEGIENKNKYSNSTLKPEVMEVHAAKLVTYLQMNKPFLESELSLKNLADQLQLTPHILSQVINQSFNKNFSDLMNSYRIEEAKLKLESIEKSNLSIEGIGMVCGFGSPSAFFKAFRKNTGLTPSQYIKKEKA